MTIVTYIPAVILFMFTAAYPCSSGFAAPGEIIRKDEDVLLDTYRRNMAKVKQSGIGIPLYLESFDRDDRVQVDVYGIFEYPFSSVVNTLKVPANWCDIVSLHPNVKACTYSGVPGPMQLALYLGHKVYEPPEDARQIQFRYHTVEPRQGYLDVVLSADAGPFGTRDHRLRVEALPLDAGRSFVHVSYAYSDSVALRLAGKIYFSTLGRDKTGFTVTGTDRNGKPVLVGGARGALERNAVRCYFAIRSHLNTLRYPEESRFRMRLSEWYDLTTRYSTQLQDLERTEYLTIKTKERENQVTLQRQTRTGVP
jgi:hypothetical protein